LKFPYGFFYIGRSIVREHEVQDTHLVAIFVHGGGDVSQPDRHGPDDHPVHEAVGLVGGYEQDSHVGRSANFALLSPYVTRVGHSSGRRSSSVDPEYLCPIGMVGTDLPEMRLQCTGQRRRKEYSDPVRPEIGLVRA
jgi:hypothetical protein